MRERPTSSRPLQRGPRPPGAHSAGGTGHHSRFFAFPSRRWKSVIHLPYDEARFSQFFRSCQPTYRTLQLHTLGERNRRLPVRGILRTKICTVNLADPWKFKALRKFPVRREDVALVLSVSIRPHMNQLPAE